MSLVFRLLTIGNKCPAWIDAGFNTYSDRLKQDVSLHLIELPPAQRPKKSGTKSPSKNASIQQFCEQETEQLLMQVKRPGLLLALDKSGRSWSTEELAEHMRRWQLEYSCVNVLIGGPDGHAPKCLQTADQCWSLSNLTFPHALVRILVAEQIYRAWSWLKGHPYHK